MYSHVRPYGSQGLKKMTTWLETEVDICVTFCRTH